VSIIKDFGTFRLNTQSKTLELNNFQGLRQPCKLPESVVNR
jgi:hypothetical protein